MDLWPPYPPLWSIINSDELEEEPIPTMEALNALGMEITAHQENLFNISNVLAQAVLANPPTGDLIGQIATSQRNIAILIHEGDSLMALLNFVKRELELYNQEVELREE